MAENKIKSLYDTFVNEGYDMESEADFRKNLADATKRKSVYDALVNDGYDMEDYADFEKNLGFGTIESQSINDIATEQGWGKSAMPIEEMPTPHPQPHPDSTIAQVRKEAEEEKQAKIDALPTPDTDKIVAGIKGFTTPSQNAYQQKMDEVDEINKAEKFGAITPQEADVKRKSLMIGDALSMANKPSDASMRRVNAEQVVKRLDDIEKSLKKRKDEVAFSSLDKYGDNAAYMMSTYSPIVERRSDREYNTLLAARRALSDAQTIIDEADRNINPEDYSKWQKNWVSGLGRGVGEKLFDVRTWDMGVNEMSDASVLYQALDKADKGEKLTEAEEALLEAKALEMATNAYFGSYLGRAYKAGQVTAQSVPFMLEMAISPLSAVGKTAQSKLVRYALKEFGGKAINNKLKKTALKYGTRLAGDLAGATGMTLSSSMPRTAADAFGRMSGNITPSFDDRGVASYGGHEGQVNAGKAMRQAVTAGTLERFSEMMGYYFAPMSKVVGKGATKMMDAPKLAKVNDFLGKVSSTDLARGMKDFQRATHWDGSISEYLEEFANNHLNALLVGDMEFNTGDKGVYNLDSNIDTFLGVSVLGGGMSAIATGYYPVYKYRQQRALVNADRNAGRAFGGDWDGIKSQLSKIDDSIKQPIADIIQSEDYTPEQKKAALQYVKAKATLKGVQEADVNKLMDVEIPTEKKEIAASYDVGRSVSTPEEKNEAKRNLDEARNALLTHFGMSIDEDVDALLGDNAIEDVLNSLEIGGSMQEAQLKLDYLNAKATFDGMIDNVRDNVKDEINESNRLIDSRTNKENNSVQPAKIGTEKENRDVFIVAGNVVLMDDGKTINRDLSSKDIVVMDKETGKLEMTTADRLFEVQPSLDANEVKTQAAREIQARITTKEGDEIDGILPFANGDVYTIMDESGAVHQASIMNNNGDGTAIVSIDGAEAVNMPTESVQAMADAFKDTQRAERKVQQAQAEQEQFAEAEKEINATPATSSIPVDENGNRQYTQVDADTAWDGLMEQTEGDADMAMIVANSMKEKAEKALEDVKKEKVADGNTPEEMISAMKAHKEAVAQAQAEVDKWNDIATTPQRRAEQARLDAEKEANAAKMQAIINDAVEKKAEQEQTETTPETQEQVAQNEGEAQNNVEEVAEPIFDNEFNKQILEDYVAGEKAKTPNAEVYEQVKEALQEEGKIQFRVRDNKEIEQIVAEAKANGTYLKAPNGADTNLTPKQWAMVRTKAFKNWFGDWGKTARIEKLRSSKDAVITGEEIEASDDLKQYRKNAHVYGRTLQGQYTNADTGSVISLQRGRHNGGINEVLQHNYKDVAHLQSVAAIPQIIENGIYIESQPNRDVETNPNVSEYQMFVCGLNIGGEDYTVLAKVAVDKNGNRYYDHNLVSVEKGKLIDIANNNQSAKSSGFGTTPDTKSTTNSLYKFNEIISILQINSSKIVDANGEPKVVYHQTNATQYINVETGENWDDLDWRAKMEWDERDDWDEYWQEQDFNEFSRVNARVTNEFDGFFFAPEYDEFHEYGKRTIEAFLNIRKPASRGDYNIDSTKNEAGRDERIRLQNEGYDGVIREYDGVVDEYIAFEPNQIKSATDNVGTFDAGNNDIRFRIADYKAEFNNLQSEYDALDKNDAVALNAWRDKKVGVVRGYLESVANRFGMKPEIIVFNGADEAQMQEAYQRLVESYKRTGNTPPTYDAFRLSSLNKEIFALYYIEADVIVNNISTKDNFNKENRYAKNLFHENAHHHIRDTFKYAELEALWNEIASSDIQLVQEINTSPIYKNENNSTKGNEFIAHSIAIIATKHKELFIQFVKGKDGVTADNVVEKLNYQKQTTNFAIAKILNLIRDEYQEARHRSGVVARAEEGGDNNLSRPSRRGNRRKRDNKRGVLVTPEQKAFYNAVAQNGLREVVGKDNYQEFLFDVFQQVDDQTRRTIVDSAMANGYDFLTATEQYFASLAKNNNQEQGFFDKLRSLFLEMLRKVGINIGNEVADNDLLYMMWRTYQKPRSKGAMGVAEDVAMREELGVGNYEVADQIPSSPKFRIATPSTGEAKRYYNNAVRRSTKTNSLKSTDNLAHKLKEAYFDSMLSVKELMEGIRRETGAPFIKDNADVYSAENRLSSTNKSQVEAWERDQFAPMMKAVTDLINKGASYDDIKEYIVAKHGLERNLVFSKKEAEKNGGQWDGSVKRDFSGLTELTGEATQFTDAAQQIVDEFEAKYNTAELWSKINAATKATLQKSFYSGMMDKETYDNLRTMFKHYVPLRGWANHAAASEYEYMGSSNMKILPTLKTAKGRTSLAEDPLATIGAMGESAIIQGNRNLMKQKLLTLALDYPTSLLTVSEQWYVKEANGKWRPESPYIPEGATGEQVADILKQFEEDMELLGEDAKKQRNGLELNLHTTTAEGEEHSVRVKRNGKEYIVYVNGNPTAAQAINGFTNPNTRTKEDWVATLMDGADKVKNFMARSFTSYNPAFVISNFARDIIFAGTAVSIKEDGSYTWQYTKNIGSFIGTATLPRLVSKWENGTLDTNIPIERMFKEFMLNGGETGYTQLNSVDEYKKQMQRLIKEAQGGAVANTKKFFRSGLDLVEFANRSVEDTTRFAVYMTSRQQGRTIAQSVADAKNITVNFNKKGRGNMGAGAFSYLYIFFNAAMQSLSNMGKLIKEHPVKSGPWLSAYGSAGFLCPFITVALQSLFGDDDESNYWDLPEWIRRNNIVLPIPFTDGYFTIPLPHELRPFYGVGEIAFSVMMGKEEVEEGLKKAIEGFAGMMPIDPTGNAGDLVTNLTPTVAQPIVQILRNRDYFGIPIYKDTPFNKYAPEWTKAYKGTSALLVDGTKAWNELWGGDKVKSSAINEKGEIKALGWLTDINPAIVEYLFESYLGGMGKTFSQTYKTIEMLWNEDTRTMRNIPIVGNFLRFPDERNNSGEVNTHYFDAINEARETERLVSGYRKEANLGSEEYAKILAEFMESPLYKRYEVMKPHIKAVNLLNNTLKDADSTNEESIKQAIYDTKKFMLEELDKFETNGYQPLQSDDAKSIEQQ